MQMIAASAAPLHVLLSTDLVGGVWDFCRVLAGELARIGHRVTLLALGAPTAAQRAEAAAVGATLLDAPLKLEWMQASADDVDTTRTLTARLVRDLRPDILHVNQYAAARLDVDIPIVLTAHSDVLSWLKWTERGGRDGPVPMEWSRYATLVRQGMQSADAVVAVSRFVADQLAELYGHPGELSVVYNGWPEGTDDPRPVIERERLTVLAGRAWDSAKNLELAVRAAGDRELGRVVHVGDRQHPESGSLRDLGPSVVAVGRLSPEQLERYLGSARVYLAPARYEPFGLLPLQAALAGCPLLLSDIPSFRELWDGVALFFRSDDARDLRAQWRRLLDDDRLAAQLAAGARRRARERYMASRMASEYVSVYRRLLAEPEASVQTHQRRSLA